MLVKAHCCWALVVIFGVFCEQKNEIRSLCYLAAAPHWPAALFFFCKMPKKAKKWIALSRARNVEPKTEKRTKTHGKTMSGKTIRPKTPSENYEYSLRGVPPLRDNQGFHSVFSGGLLLPLIVFAFAFVCRFAPVTILFLNQTWYNLSCHNDSSWPTFKVS